MTNTTVPAGSTPAPKSLLARFVGIITAPTETFQAVVAHPKWLGMLVLVAVILAVGGALPMMSEEGQQAAIDTNVRNMESFGMTVDDRTYEGMQRGAKIMPYTAAGGVLLMTPIMTLIFAGILFAIFNAAMGGTATFKQVFAVVVHAGVISALGQIFTGPLNYFRGQMGSATNLSVMLPMLDEGSFMARLAGMIDIFLIWWVLVLAIGLAVLFRRRTQSIAVALFSVYAAIALVAAAVMSRMGGGN